MKQLDHETQQQQTSGEAARRSTTQLTPAPSDSVAPATGKESLTRWLFRGLLFGVAATVSATLAAASVLMVPLPNSIAPESARKPLSLGDLWQQGLRYDVTRPVNILVMGIDLPLNLPEDAPQDDVFAGRSDTMMLVHLDPDRETVNVLSIPRDTQVEIPGEGIDKINYANAAGGAKLSAQVVSRTLNGVTIDRYVRVSTGAFRELVDLMGGVDVYVPERMSYQDDTQKLKIDLYPGQQTLSGEQAEQFARFRNDENGDIGRVQRQQQLIRALREKLTNPILLARVPQAIELFQKRIDTNLSFEEMLALANFGLGLERENFRMVMLPGRFSTPEEYVASYWLLDSAGKDQVMHEYFDISSVAVLSQHSRDELKIAIQNASSNPALGSQMAAYLQSQGFDNVYVIQDWPDPQSETQIIVQGGDLQSADTLQSVLGVGQVIPASTGELSSDLTIRVGDDWAEKPQV